MRKTKEFPGREIRGLRFRVYPTPEQEAEITNIQRKLRRMWNWLVAQADATRAANEAWAAKNGAGPRPARPENNAGEDAWAEYKDRMRCWYADVKTTLKPHRTEEAFRYRTVRDYCAHFGVRHDFQLFPHVIKRHDDPEDAPEDPPAACLLQALFKAYDQALAATRRGQAPPRRKKRDADVLIQSGSGKLFRRGAFGTRPGMPNGRGDWLDAQIRIPNLGQIGCRVGDDRGLEPSEYWVEGVSLVREGDGWFGAIRQHIVPKPKPKGSGCCGIDVGLVYMFAAVGDDGATLLADNTRKGESMKRRTHTPHGYVELIAARQAAGLPVSRMHCRAARHAREYVRRELFPFTDLYEFIAVEDLPSDIGQRGRPHLSFMRTIRTMLIQRYGSERVIDVDPAGTSRTCSMCGEKQQRSWSDLPQRTGKCHACGHVEHSDLNAARNVLHKLTKSQAAE